MKLNKKLNIKNKKNRKVLIIIFLVILLIILYFWFFHSKGLFERFESNVGSIPVESPTIYFINLQSSKDRKDKIISQCDKNSYD